MGSLTAFAVAGILAGVMWVLGGAPAAEQPAASGTCNGLEATVSGDGSVVGTTGDDVILTGDGPDRVLGLGGDDVICTNRGDDLVDAGTESDWVDGGAGFDTCGSGESVVDCEDDLIVGAVIEEGVDLDSDGVDDEVEQRFGSSPAMSDTDGDGLTDYFEVRHGGLDQRPDLADSDGDGVGDSAEDSDGDGLDALAEQAAGTRPLTADSDEDGLDDGDELQRGSDPLEPDTDGDGLLDGVEVSRGTDPALTDSDGDGHNDDRELRTVTAASPDRMASVSITAPAGSFHDGIEVRMSKAADAEGFPPGAGVVGDAVVVDTGELDLSTITAASITISYPPSIGAGEAKNLKVFALDGETGSWDLADPFEEQVLDSTAGTVTAEVTQLSEFALIDVVAWREHWSKLRGN